MVFVATPLAAIDGAVRIERTALAGWHAVMPLAYVGVTVDGGVTALTVPFATRRLPVAIINIPTVIKSMFFTLKSARFLKGEVKKYTMIN